MGKKVKKPTGKKKAQLLGPGDEMYLAYCGQAQLVPITEAGIEEAIQGYLQEKTRAGPWRPLGKVHEKQYPKKTFHEDKVHGAAWKMMSGSGCVQYLAVNWDKNVERAMDVWDLEAEIKAHPWTGKCHTGRIFSFRQTGKQQTKGDHESEVNIVFMNVWGETWEASLTKHNDVTKKTDTGMIHIWIRTQKPCRDQFMSQAMCNFLCHVAHFEPLYPHGPGGQIMVNNTSCNYSCKYGQPAHGLIEGRLATPLKQILPKRKPVNFKGPTADISSSSCQDPGVEGLPPRLLAAPQASQSSGSMGTPVADAVVTPLVTKTAFHTPKAALAQEVCMPLAAQPEVTKAKVEPSSFMAKHGEVQCPHPVQAAHAQEVHTPLVAHVPEAKKKPSVMAKFDDLQLPHPPRAAPSQGTCIPLAAHVVEAKEEPGTSSVVAKLDNVQRPHPVRKAPAQEVCTPLAAHAPEEECASVMATCDDLRNKIEKGAISVCGKVCFKLEDLAAKHVKDGNVLRLADFQAMSERAPGPLPGSLDIQGPQSESEPGSPTGSVKGQGENGPSDAESDMYPPTASPRSCVSISFESLPFHSSTAGPGACPKLRHHNGHGVSSQEEVDMWVAIQDACGDAGAHKVAIFENGPPQFLGPQGLYEPMEMVLNTETTGGASFQVPASYAHVDHILNALGARVCL